MMQGTNRFDGLFDGVLAETRTLGALAAVTALPDLEARARQLRATVDEIEAHSEATALRVLTVEEIEVALYGLAAPRLGSARRREQLAVHHSPTGRLRADAAAPGMSV